MVRRPLRGRVRRGFTLVELLTVIAVIGILATLLASGMSTAKKASHRARCMSNLHQMSLGLHLYLDDYRQRPTNLTELVASRCLPNPGVLLCPADKYGGWGTLVQPQMNQMAPSFLMGDRAVSSPASDTNLPPFSYLHPFEWSAASWQTLLQKGSLAGIAACQLHGLGRPHLASASLRDFQGLVLRAQQDGAVVKRQVFWDTTVPLAVPTDNQVFISLGTEKGVPSGITQWQLFSDEPIP